MIDWEWENFEARVTSDHYIFKDHGPLFGPIQAFTIKRNPDLALILETKCSINASSSAIEYPLGTVRQNEDIATLESILGGTAVTLTGVQPQRHTKEYRLPEPDGEICETATVHKLAGQTINQSTPVYIIDWISNVSSTFIWPDITDEECITTKKVILGIGENALTMVRGSKSGNTTRNGVKLNIAGYEIFLCHLDGNQKIKIKKPGFILYTEMPSAEIREKIRIILSFLLGIYFVYLGHSVFCKDWRLVSYEAISAYALGGSAYKLPPCPPAPLGKMFEWEIDRTILSNMANKLYTHYDTLNFRSLSWALWHALSAVSHIAPVHYGAAIEALQNAYIKSNENKFNRKLLDGESWSSIKKQVEEIIDKSTTEKNLRYILKNKISNLNEKPSNIIMIEVLECLGLSLSKVERNAWQNRNLAAHGVHPKNENFIQQIRETKLLWLRFNRLLFAITEASDVYYDYYSLDRPTRKIKEEIP